MRLKTINTQMKCHNIHTIRVCNVFLDKIDLHRKKLHHIYLAIITCDPSICILQIRIFSRGFYFREASHMRSFVKIKSSRNGENHSVVY